MKKQNKYGGGKIKRPHLCQAPYCRKNKPVKDIFCPKHRKRLQREQDPEAYFYNALKCNAKRREKYFDITLEEFRIFCKETEYIKNKGKNADSASIDRIDADKGYTISNLQILSLGDNTRKMHTDKYLPF